VTSQGADQQPAPRRGLLVIYSALMLALLLAALDQTIVATALPTIVSDLGGLSHLSLVVTANILDSTATTQVWGKLGDQFGRKYLFIAAIVIFLIRLGAVRAFPEHGRADRLPCAPRTWPARPR
jgi:MFS family permease